VGARATRTPTDLLSQAYELSVLTGTQVLLLVVSETGLVYTFTTPKLQPLVTKAEGKNLIQVWIFVLPATKAHHADMNLGMPERPRTLWQREWCRRW
jgi:hypothetical protein